MPNRLQNIRRRLRESPLAYSTYMQLKRWWKSELLGMTSKTEQEYFAKYGKDVYMGKGEVVDIGCWLGSTTIPLVKGLLKNPAFAESNKSVYAYDAFIWHSYMESGVAGTSLVGKYKEGDSFLDEYRKRTKDYASRIEICAGDLSEIGWNGKEIEFLLIDAMKTWNLANAILKHFYTALIPSQSYVLHQDFAHFFTSWIHLLQWHFRAHFEIVEEVPAAASVVFKYVKKIPVELLTKNYSFDDFSDDDIDKAFDYSLSLVSEEKQINIGASKVMCFVHQKRFSDAERILQDLFSRGIPRKKDILIVENLIRENANN